MYYYFDKVLAFLLFQNLPAIFSYILYEYISKGYIFTFLFRLYSILLEKILRGTELPSKFRENSTK